MKNRSELIVLKNSSGNVTNTEAPFIFVSNFNDTSFKDFYSKFVDLQANNNILIIPVVISSFGGEIHSLLAMLDIIKSSKKPVATIGLGKAMSCGAVLLSAGTKGYRYAGPNADIMIHEAGSFTGGKTADIEQKSIDLKRLNKTLMHELSNNANKPKDYFIKRVHNRANTDWHLSAEECKKMGLVDFVGVPSMVKE